MVSVHQVANACVLKWESLPVMAILNHVDRDNDHQPKDLGVPLGYLREKAMSDISVRARSKKCPRASPPRPMQTNPCHG